MIDSNAWKRYAGDFNAMTDDEVERELNIALNDIDAAEEWVEAVTSWKAAGKPRKNDDE